MLEIFDTVGFFLEAVSEPVGVKLLHPRGVYNMPERY